MNKQLIEKIYYITNENLEDYSPPYPNLGTIIERYNFVKISGISAFWEESDKGSRIAYEKCMEDVLTGVSSQKSSIVYLILSFEKKINIFIGTNDTDTKNINTVLKTYYPGIILIDLSNTDKSDIKQHIDNFSHCAQIIGTPTNKMLNKDGTTKTQIEGLFRGLYGEKWAYIVNAQPLASSNITSFFNTIAQEIHDIHTKFILKGTNDEENPLAKHYIELLEAKLAKFKVGKIKGAWNVKSFVFAQNPHLLKRINSIVTSTFVSEQSLPDKIQAYPCKRTNKKNTDVLNNLNTEELSILTQLPREELSGYAITGYSRFGVDFNKKIDNPIYLGEIIDRGNLTGNHFKIDIKDLSKHCLITGVTGSGKTNTCFHILQQIWAKYKIPFLVIESAKSEYRDLMNTAEFKECNVFTLGDDTIAPFRLNPFEVSEGILIQSHIDYLKSLFNASFVLYAPMPYILEQSIHEIYEDKGWDISVNKNYRGASNKKAYPTLTDLYNKIGVVVDRLGYDERISMDVKAALKARINNLRIGGKGLMLNTQRSISKKDLFEKPAILELKQFVNDEEKAFVIGLILIRLYEYYEAQYRTGLKSNFGDFRHITLIEEAHRLLKNVSTESGGEDSANPKGKAVETFANILSEIRAYGEGILIAEQIPVKLTPDAIKNTNLKILQRIVAADDRDVMGETMNLDDKQKKFITTLHAGEAIAYAEGLHKPFLIRIPNYKAQLPSSKTSNQMVFKLMQRYYYSNPDLLLRYDNCRTCKERGGKCEKVHNEAEKIISQKPFKEAFSRLFSSFIHDKTLVSILFTDMLFIIRQLSKVTTKDEESSLIYCVLTRYAEYTFESRGSFYKWDFQKGDILIKMFNEVIQKLVYCYGKTKSVTLETSLKPLIKSISNEYIKFCSRERVPYVSCKLCINKCLFQYEIQTLLNEYSYFNEYFDVAFYKNGKEDIADVCTNAAKLIVSSENKVALRQISLCFASYKCANIGLTTSDQEKLCGDIYKIINKKGIN
ncbi:MAG: ATP-binding protein [Desulfobacterales bacterium]|nr:ATP-binding protein [Desulfobacterales bacterium]